jgi:hypothetical protein
MAEIKCVHTSDTLMRGMNPHLIASAGLFVVSELLPYLPCKENSVIQIGVRGLHLAKLVPDDVFESFKKASQANSTQQASSSSSSSLSSAAANTPVHINNTIQLKPGGRVRITIDVNQNHEKLD